MNTPCWNGGGRGASVLAPGALLFLPPPSLQGSSSHFFSSFLPFFQHLSPFLPQILQGTTSRAEGLGCALPWPSQNLPRTSQNQSEAAPASPQRPLSPWAPNTATIKAKFANQVLHIWTNTGVWAQTGPFQSSSMKDAYSSPSCRPEDSKETGRRHDGSPYAHNTSKEGSCCCQHPGTALLISDAFFSILPGFLRNLWRDKKGLIWHQRSLPASLTPFFTTSIWGIWTPWPTSRIIL